MGTVGFWHNVQTKPKLLGLNNFCESYFYLDGISDKLGTKKYTVLANGKLRLDAPQPMNLKKFLKTALKILTYITIVVPIVVFVLKLGFRCSTSYKVESTKVKIGTYNILFPQKKVKEDGSLPKFSTGMGYNKKATGEIIPNTKSRTKIIENNLKKANLDIVCVQELTDNVNQQLSASFPEYSNVYAKHKNNHGVAVFYDNRKFKLLNQQVLSGTFSTISGLDPNVTINSPRSAVMVDLQDKTTKKVIRVVSGHFIDPSLFKENKKQYVDWVVNEAERQPCIRTEGKNLNKPYQIEARIIAGDMNQDQYGNRNSSAYSGNKSAKPSGVVPSAKKAAVFKPLFKNGYGVDNNLDPTEFWKDLETDQIHSKDRKIDWIFVKGAKVTHHAVKGLNNKGSDHALVASLVTV